jgi:transglutaminase-like putative cysteine protease
MRKTKLCAFTLFAIMLLSMLPPTVLATESVQLASLINDISTVTELRAALENDEGTHIKLIKDITFTVQNAADADFGVILGEGYYTIDLNGHKIEYNYKGRNGDPNGSPLVTRNTKGLTINGPGNIVGGSYAVEQGNPRGFLKVNGGKLDAVINSGIRMTGGIAYINGGTVTGNFYGVFHEDGIVVLNGGTVKSVRYKNMGYQSRQYGVVENGIFTGNATLDDLVLIIDDLTISAGSSIKTIRGGGLIVKNSFVNNGTFTYESGIKSIGGEALISNYLMVTIGQDVTFSSLKIQDRGWLTIENGATVTVSDTFVTEQGCSIIAENGTLRLLGSIDHGGYAKGVPKLEALQDGNVGGGPGPGSVPGQGQRDFVAETTTAEKLKALGLFQGVGTNPDGSTNFDLARKPSRIEALVMLIRLLGKDNEAISGSWTHPFTDVPDWANNYVGYAYENKLTNGISATEFGTGTVSYQMYLTFVLRALGYSDTGGVDFTWDKPDDLALSIGIMAVGMHHEDFLRADVVLVSEAALSVKLKNSSDTLLDKLETPKNKVESESSIPVWTDTYTQGMRVQTSDELYSLIDAAFKNLIPQFEIILDNATYDVLVNDDEFMLKYVNLGVTHSDYDYQTNLFSYRIDYSVFHQMQGLIFNRNAVEQYASAEVRDYDTQMRAIRDKIIVPNMTDRQKVKAVHDHIVTNYKYDTDFESGLYGNDTYAFHGLLKNGTGVCQAYAELFFLFMCYEDIECYYVTGWAKSETGEYGLHAWNVVYVEDGYYHVDVTFDDPVPDTGNKISYDYFLKIDEEMAKDHDW